MPGLIELEFLEAERGRIRGRLALREELLAPNGYLHAATVIAFADTACGYSCFVSLPEDAEGFTTVELKSNFLGTKREGALECEATLVYGGRTTQVWDAIFRCTQMVFYPR